MSGVNGIPDAELVKRVIARAAQRLPATARGKAKPLWHQVGEQFCLGSTYSADLCRRFGFDPDQQVRP